MNQTLNRLKKSERVLVASHVNPDGDAIGSLIAMGQALDALGKTVCLYNESPIPAVYRFLPGVQRITASLGPLAAYDTAVILDCGDLNRIGAEAERVRQIPVIVNIDHHVTNNGFGSVQLIDTDACATAEIIYRLVKRLGVEIDTTFAVATYTGILTDTGSFRFSNTNHAAFAICREMVEKGVRPYDVAQQVYGTYSLGRIKLLNLALDSIEISKNGLVSMMTVTRHMLHETGTQPEDADGLINYARRIEDVKMAALIQEEGNGIGRRRIGNHFHVSLRSDGTVDVAAIAAAFGGGGHPTAAGFNIEMPLSELKARVIRLSENIVSNAA